METKNCVDCQREIQEGDQWYRTGRCPSCVTGVTEVSFDEWRDNEITYQEFRDPCPDWGFEPVY